MHHVQASPFVQVGKIIVVLDGPYYYSIRNSKNIIVKKCIKPYV